MRNSPAEFSEAAPGIPGHYTIAVLLKEWRFAQNLDEWINITSTIFDFDMIIRDTENHAPRIMMPADTAVLYIRDLEIKYWIDDPEGDSLTIRHSGTIFTDPANKPAFILNDSGNDPGVAEGKLSWWPGLSSVSPVPYVFSLLAEETGEDWLSVQKVAWIWVTGRESTPEPPVNLVAVSQQPGTMLLSWENVTPDAAGIVIERADDLSPEFRRLAGLPSTFKTYLDNHVVTGRNYRYRIKALGTEASAMSDILDVQGDFILGAEIRQNSDRFSVFPNPAGDILYIQPGWTSSDVAEFSIFDISGKLVYFSSAMVSIGDILHLPLDSIRPGLYILRIRAGKTSYTTRFTKI